MERKDKRDGIPVPRGGFFFKPSVRYGMNEKMEYPQGKEGRGFLPTH